MQIQSAHSIHCDDTHHMTSRSKPKADLKAFGSNLRRKPWEKILILQSTQVLAPVLQLCSHSLRQETVLQHTSVPSIRNKRKKPQDNPSHSPVPHAQDKKSNFPTTMSQKSRWPRTSYTLSSVIWSPVPVHVICKQNNSSASSEKTQWGSRHGGYNWAFSN